MHYSKQTYYSRIRRDSVCNTFQDPIITSVIDAKKITAWGESGFPARFLGILDLILIPITAAPYEIMITANLVHRGVQNGWNMALVPNNLPSIKTRRQQLRVTLTGMGIPIAPASLIRRVTHWDAILAGLGVCEFAPNSPAAAEMQVLWDWLSKQISLIENQQPDLNEEILYA